MERVGATEREENDGDYILIAVLVVLVAVLICVVYRGRITADDQCPTPPAQKKSLGGPSPKQKVDPPEPFGAEWNDGRYGCGTDVNRCPHWKLYRSPLRKWRTAKGSVCLTPDQRTAAMFMDRVVEIGGRGPR